MKGIITICISDHNVSMDKYDKATRSKMMAAVASKHTKPEIIVRSLLFRAGFRYRLHKRNLPGRPDMVLPKYNAVIFVHGCFWHFHGCNSSRMPSSNKDYWHPKIKRNLERDQQHIEQLLNDGWRVLTIWECAIRGKQKLEPSALLARVIQWLNSNKQTDSIG